MSIIAYIIVGLMIAFCVGAIVYLIATRAKEVAHKHGICVLLIAVLVILLLISITWPGFIHWPQVG